MHYEGHIIRPPSEANSILLQVTVGCSHNKCSFCGTYKGGRFRIKEDAVIMEDIAFAASYCKRQRRLFLCDGDALIIPQKRLLNILLQIKEQLQNYQVKESQAQTKINQLSVELSAMNKSVGRNGALMELTKEELENMVDWV